jgi:hypothetical protein
MERTAQRAGREAWRRGGVDLRPWSCSRWRERGGRSWGGGTLPGEHHVAPHGQLRTGHGHEVVGRGAVHGREFGRGVKVGQVLGCRGVAGKLRVGGAWRLLAGGGRYEARPVECAGEAVDRDGDPTMRSLLRFTSMTRPAVSTRACTTRWQDSTRRPRRRGGSGGGRGGDRWARRCPAAQAARPRGPRRRVRTHASADQASRPPPPALHHTHIGPAVPSTSRSLDPFWRSPSAGDPPPPPARTTSGRGSSSYRRAGCSLP